MYRRGISECKSLVTAMVNGPRKVSRSISGIRRLILLKGVNDAPRCCCTWFDYSELFVVACLVFMIRSICGNLNGMREVYDGRVAGVRPVC